MRSKLNDVAREAGVSPATVDRVLNNRAGVRSRTRDIVIETAKRLGYIAGADPSASTTRPVVAGKHRVDVILPAGSNPFISALHQHIQSLARFRPNLDVHMSTIEGFNPDSLARALIDLRDKTRGVALIALDHPTVREAIRTLAAAGIKVVTIASDILHVPRIAYVGIDNRAAGRLAGYLVKRFVRDDRPAKVALFAGSLSYRGHEEREMGFRHILAEESPHLTIVELREMLDDQDRAYAEACALITQHPDLAAIYNAGAGTAGIARALKESGRDQTTVFIAHDMTPDNKMALLDGTVDAIIDQNPRVEAREALNILAHAISETPFDYHAPRLQVIFRENIPEF